MDKTFVFKESKIGNISFGAALKRKAVFVLDFIFKIAGPFRVFVIVFFRVFDFIFFRLKVKGLGNLANIQNGRVLFIANHHTKIDPFFIGSSLPWSFYRRIKYLRYLSDSKQITRRLYGPLIWLMGAYPVHRYRGDYERSLASSLAKLRDNQSILMFPTGWREKIFDHKNVLPGVAYIARAVNPLIVPVRVTNLYRFNLLEAFLGRYRVTVNFGRPFRWREVADNGHGLPDAAARIMAKVAELDE